eukprot:285627-Chlamydomonas_euryale.AAC.2
MDRSWLLGGGLAGQPLSAWWPAKLSWCRWRGGRPDGCRRLAEDRRRRCRCVSTGAEISVTDAGASGRARGPLLRSRAPHEGCDEVDRRFLAGM